MIFLSFKTIELNKYPNKHQYNIYDPHVLLLIGYCGILMHYNLNFN